MSNELINALETRVNNAVDTIENLRSEVKELRENRMVLEDKLRELLLKFGAVENNGTESTSDTDSEQDQNSGYGFRNAGMGSGSSSEY